MEDNKCLTQFVYKYNGPTDDEIRVVGSIEQLGNWDVNNSQPLNFSPSENVYKSKENITLPKYINLEYKYLIFRNNNLLKWEDLPNNGNRRIDTKNNSNIILYDEEGDNKTQIKNKKLHTQTKPQTLKSVKKKKKENKPTPTETNIQNIEKTHQKPKQTLITSTEPKETKEPMINFEEEEEPPKKIKKKKLKKKKKKSSNVLKKDSDKKNNVEDKNIKSAVIEPKEVLEVDDQLEEKLKLLDYPSGDKEKKNEKEQKPIDTLSKLAEITDEDEIIMCSFYLPFTIEFKENDVDIKETNTPLYHTLYETIIKDKNSKIKNIKWFGCLKNVDKLNEEQKNDLKERLKEENMFLLEIKPEIFEQTKILFEQILEPFCKYITLGINDMDNYVKFSDYWRAYKQFIEETCKTIMDEINKKTIIFLHDYEFCLFPSIFYNKCGKEHPEKLANISMGLFMHTPFPSHEIFKRIPFREEIISSLIKLQVLGFHTFDNSRNFLKTAKRLLGANYVSSIYGDLAANYLDNNVLIKVKNVTPEISLIKKYTESDDFQKIYKRYTEKYKNKKIFLSLEHLTFPTAIKNKLIAYRRFLKALREKSDRIVLLMYLRDDVSEIKNIEDKEIIEKIATLITEIQNEFGENSIEVFYGELNYEKRLALLSCANCYIRASRYESYSLSLYEFLILKKLFHKEKESVYMISELAGVNTSLAYTVKTNPFDYSSLYNGFTQANNQLCSEQDDSEFSEKDFQHAMKSSFTKWFYSFVQDIKNTKLSDENVYYLGGADDFDFKLKKIGKNFKNYKDSQIINDYEKSFKRLIFLDYEGTLPSENIGQGSKTNKLLKGRKPSEEILSLLKELVSDKRNKVFIVAGKGNKELSEWFGSVKHLCLAAEHGFLYCVNNNDAKWKRTLEKCDTEWRRNCVNIIVPYTQRCEGSFLEIKASSVVWQYSECDQELGKAFASVITSELKIELKNENVKVTNGKGYVEVSTRGINKGVFISYILKDMVRNTNKIADFIVCVGDDKTDEKMFKYLKNKESEIRNYSRNAKLYSITVGKKPSEAKYYADNTKDVENLIENFVKSSRKFATSISTLDIKSMALNSKFSMDDEEEEEELKELKLKH